MTKTKPKSADDLFEAGGSVMKQEHQQASAPPRDTPPVETDDGARGRPKETRVRVRARRKREAAIRAQSKAEAKSAREAVPASIATPSTALTTGDASLATPVRTVAEQTAPQPMSLLALVGQALANPEVDVTKLTGLIDWYDRREADNAFARDFLAMAKKLPEIKRDGTIDQGITRSGRQGVKAKYATYENIHEATSDILHEFGFTLSIRNELRGETTVIILRLEHYDQRFGSSFRESIQPIIRDDGPGKTVVQAWGSGEQYQQRRMVIKLLNLRSRAPIDDDKDGADPAKVAAAEAKAKEDAKPATAAQIKELRAKIEKADGLSEERVCEKYGVPKLEDLPMKALADAHKALDNWIAARNGQAASHG